MFLHRIHLDPRCREARRDLADPYQLHSTLCRAFCDSAQKCPEGALLWRLEPETNSCGHPRVLVQSVQEETNWARIPAQGWLAKAEPAVNLMERLDLDSLTAGASFRFRLRANPCVTRNGKRLGLMQCEDQEGWLIRKSKLHGFSLPRLSPFDFADSEEERIAVRISHEGMLRGKQRSGNAIHIFSVLFDGVLTVTEPEEFRKALRTGIGHGKAMGLGLLSVAPIGS